MAGDELSPRVLVLFGASGDLALRMLFPALFELFGRGLMPADFRVVGSGRHSPGSDDEFRGKIADALGDEAEGERWDELAKKISFVTSDDDDFSDLSDAVRSAEEEIDAAEDSRLVYLSVPPEAMPAMVDGLSDSGLLDGATLVTEKPFGGDLEGARELNRSLHEAIDEDSIYRIDHFLGKEAVANLLALRFANDLLEPLWSAERIAYVQVDIPEEIDIEGRGSFYEETGAFSDMVVNHLLQTLGAVAMEAPTGAGAEPMHAARDEVLAAIAPLDPGRVVFGQYDGYRDEDDVAEDSERETFAALEARVENERWRGVPFYLRTGKAMADTRRTVVVGLRDEGEKGAFEAGISGGERPNEIVFELADDPWVEVTVRAKRPGPGTGLTPAAFRLDLAAATGEHGLEAYARLLLDAMREDRTLFSTAAQVERLWEICQPVLQDPPEPRPYEKGSWGPREALELPAAPGWRLPDDGGS